MTISRSLLFACLSFFFFAPFAYADKPVCQTHPTGGYCSYTGHVQKIYVNAAGDILIYFDTPFDSEQDTTVAGFTISSNGRLAATVRIADGADFAKLFYSTALSAQATKRKIDIQMRNTHNGYLKVDRIWLSEE